MSSFIIGVAGGSGSGKTTVTQHIVNSLDGDAVAVIKQDYYYKDLTYLTLEDRRKVNFDHPDAFDWDLLIKHVDMLYNGLPIEMPVYDFAKDNRSNETILVSPAPVVVFEGIFALMNPEVLKLMGLKIFVDTAADIRFIRRLERDTIHRGRSVDSVVKQYLGSVRPMYKKFVEPTKRNADIIIPHGANKAALEMIIARIKSVLNQDQLGSELSYELND